MSAKAEISPAATRGRKSLLLFLGAEEQERLRDADRLVGREEGRQAAAVAPEQHHRAGVDVLRESEPAVLLRDLDPERPHLAESLDDVFGDLAVPVDLVRVHPPFEERLKLAQERVLLQCNYKNSHFLNILDRTTSEDRHFITMRLAEEVTFLNKGAIKKELSQVPDNSILVIDQSNCVYINHDVAEIIYDFIHAASILGNTT